jgi:8-oxo-dGTP diphosphatase
MPVAEWIRQLREIVGTELIVSIGAAAIIRDEQGRILLQQRSDTGRWGLPGGAVDPGEEPAEAAVREAFEETGLHVEPIKLVGLFGGKGQIVQYPNGDRTAYVSATFECRVIGGEIIPISDETLDVRWFAPDELPDSFVEAHRRRIAAYLMGETPFFLRPDSFSPLNGIGYIEAIRGKLGGRLLMLPGTIALIFNESGEVLIQKRRDNGNWNLPGGIYEIGEEPAETLMRELYEETGLYVQPRRLVGIYAGKDWIVTYPNNDQVAYMSMVFEAIITGGELRIDEESLDLRFVSPDNLPAPFAPQHRRLIQYALDGKEAHFIYQGKEYC